MIKKYLQNQSGAALILVLFMVLFLAITGAMLLNTTTYSQKSIINNERVQSEFYKLEGALDLAIFEIYDDEIGPFMHIENIGIKSENYYSIDDSDVKVKIEPVILNTNEFKVVLNASIDTNSTMQRIVELNVTRTSETKEGSFGVGNTITFADGNIGESDKVYVNPALITQITSIQYFDLVNVLKENGNIVRKTSGIDIKNGTTTLPIVITSGSYPSLKVSTNGATAVIPQGVVVHADQLEVGANATLIVHGVLVVDKVTLSGNANILISSGIVTNDSDIKSSSANVVKAIGETTGISCELVFGSGICLGESSPEITDTGKGTLGVNFYETIRN